MATEEEKRIKNEFRKKAQKNPEKYYPVSVLKERGFKRFLCKKCGNYFWSIKEREVCGDPNCVGEYEFVGKKVIKPIEFPDVWKRFASFFEKKGYTPIARYPVVARWREDIFFVEASIDDFIPFVLEGVCEPPANPLVVPQFCLRFNDIENVGVTGRHYTGFVMFGQHAFEKPENYKPEEYLLDIYEWLIRELKIPEEEIQFHEDAWAGSGKMGPSLEYFSYGLELGNQVYMQFDIRHGIRELPLKVLDMGSGQERYVWFSHGNIASYECVMPSVVKMLFSQTGVKRTELFERFIPFSGRLNLDEVADIDEAWQGIAREMGIDVKELKENVYPLTCVYAIAEHTRTLLIALHDGALPSNVGGGYNLRVILRRCFDFIERFGWNIELCKIIEEHARFLRPQYPELSENLDEIFEIIEHEKKKFSETRKRAMQIISKLRKEELTVEKMIELYDSHGIHPETLKERFGVKIPSNFYALVTARHGKEERKKERMLPSVEGCAETQRLYYENPELFEFDAKVLKILPQNWIVLDKTAFYPRGGGQEPDLGKIANLNVVDVESIGNVILHKVDCITFKEGEIVKCIVDKDRRKRIMAHHTAVHILNGACRNILGSHVWQAGSYKDDKKARLDITHYKSISEEELEKIEKMCNEIIAKAIPVEKFVLPRTEAEKRYGFRIYQGGAVPGREIRIVKIGDFDIEACGGLHVNNTAEVGGIVILNTTKIQDAVVRLEIVAGDALKDLEKSIERKINRLCEILEASEDKLVQKVKELIGEKEILEKKLKEREKNLVKSVEHTLEREKIANFFAVISRVDAEMNTLREISRRISDSSTVVVLIGKKNQIFIACGENTGINARELLSELIKKFGGKGGGSEKIAQGFVENVEGVEKWLKEKLRELGKN